MWPVRGPVTSPFCERRAWEACHPGIDIGVPTGTPILAAAAGRVSVVQPSGSSGGYGNFTCLQHTSALTTCYAHQQRFLVRVGEVVGRGQPIGISDCTGRCYGSHLHFEVRLDGRVVCPARYLGVPLELDVRPRVARAHEQPRSRSARSRSRSPWRSPAARTRTPQRRPARVIARSQGSGYARRHRPARPASRTDSARRGEPIALRAGRCSIVRDALGQLGLAISRRRSNAPSLASPPAALRGSCARTRPARASTRASRATNPGHAGTVAAIDLKANVADAAGVVVTREQTYTAGRADLGGQRYRVYLVRLTRDAIGWGVSAWQPQP